MVPSLEARLRQRCAVQKAPGSAATKASRSIFRALFTGGYDGRAGRIVTEPPLLTFNPRTNQSKIQRSCDLRKATCVPDEDPQAGRVPGLKPSWRRNKYIRARRELISKWPLVLSRYPLRPYSPDRRIEDSLLLAVLAWGEARGASARAPEHSRSVRDPTSN